MQSTTTVSIMTEKKRATESGRARRAEGREVSVEKLDIFHQYAARCHGADEVAEKIAGTFHRFVAQHRDVALRKCSLQHPDVGCLKRIVMNSTRTFVEPREVAPGRNHEFDRGQSRLRLHEEAPAVELGHMAAIVFLVREDIHVRLGRGEIGHDNPDMVQDRR